MTAHLLRSLNTTPSFWLAMLIGSAFGTNLGDFVVGDLALGRIGSFVALTTVCALAIWRDRPGTEGYYWIAIVALRAAATNLGDLVTHDLHVNYLGASIAAAVLTLVVGTKTRPGAVGSPLIDAWYWGAMLIAGFFGTVAGDMIAHAIGHFAAAGLLVPLLVLLLFARAKAFPAVMVGYWAVVLLERCAGTPVGDMIASRRAMGLGDAVATAITATLFLAALLLRRSADRKQVALA